MPYPTPLRSYNPSDIGEAHAERVAPLLARTADRLNEIDRCTYDQNMDLMPAGAYNQWREADRTAWQARTNVTRDLANRADNAERASAVAWDVADGFWY